MECGLSRAGIQRKIAEETPGRASDAPRRQSVYLQGVCESGSSSPLYQAVSL